MRTILGGMCVGEHVERLFAARPVSVGRAVHVDIHFDLDLDAFVATLVDLCFAFEAGARLGCGVSGRGDSRQGHREESKRGGKPE